MAYDVRISDWSSDVCASDLPHKPVFFRRLPQGVFVPEQAGFERRVNKGIGIRLKIPKGCLGVAKIKIVDKVGVCRIIGCKQTVLEADLVAGVIAVLGTEEIGRASGRERVCQYV